MLDGLAFQLSEGIISNPTSRFGIHLFDLFGKFDSGLI
jgi:hypothetical protein